MKSKTHFPLLVGLATTIVLYGCSTDTNSIVGADASGRVKKATTSPAHPVVAYSTGAGAIAVMDSDGTHQTTIYSPSTGWTTLNGAHWTPSGSLVWTEHNADWSDNRIRLIDVSVNSSGVPVGSNLRTIVENTDSGFPGFIRVKWSSTSSINRIAFTTVDDFSETAYLCTASSSGGTWDTIHTVALDANHGIGDIAWSPDDSRIVWVVGHSSGYAAVVVNPSTGNTTDSIQLGSSGVNGIDWSHGTTSLNKIAYRYGNLLYYVTPTSGSSPTTNSLSCLSAPTWSPTNSSVMYVQQERNGSYSVMKATAMTSATTTLVRNWSGGWSYLDWR